MRGALGESGAGSGGEAVAQYRDLTIWDVAGMCVAECCLFRGGGKRPVLAVPEEGGGSMWISGFDDAAVDELRGLPDGKGGSVLFSRAGWSRRDSGTTLGRTGSRSRASRWQAG